MKTKYLVVLAYAGLAFLLSTCAPARGPTAAPSYPECPPNEMIAPSLVNPQNGTIISSLDPTFEWASPGYYFTHAGQNTEDMQACTTSGFNLYLSSAPQFQDALGGQTGGAPALYSLYTKTWKPGTPLEPGREYRWSVRPISQGQEGPMSDVRTFFTGPACAASALSAPIPLSPNNNAVVHDLTAFSLKWWYPDGCLPDKYEVRMAPSPNFYLQVDDPHLNVADLNSPALHWTPQPLLADCMRYYWRVIPFVGNQPGPASQIYTFRVAISGGCPPETNGIVQGTVWEDQCVGPGAGTPVPDTPPLGCVYKNGDQIFTNQTYDPGEPGIPGIDLWINKDTCPSQNGWNAYNVVDSQADGQFFFYEMPPGNYCVEIQSNDEHNTPRLNPGNWTYPLDAVNTLIARQFVTVNAGQVTNNTNFGWWYKYGTAWGSTNATVFGQVWHDMCAYTPGDPIPDPLPAGCSIDQWGNVHADAVHQADEPGIPGVTVDLGQGDCPSAGMATAVTNVTGYYSFNDLPVGKYCLRIDPAHGSPNEAILMPGSWTMPLGGHEGMAFRPITLTANHTLSGQNFAWDYDNLPLALTPTATPSPAPITFTPNINAYCRSGPDGSFFSDELAMKGQAYLMDGRNLANTWYRIMVTAVKGCWVPASSGLPSGDPLKLRVLFEVPTYTPTNILQLPTYTPTPKHTPTPTLACSSHTDQKSCQSDKACTWVSSTLGPGYCKAK